MLLKSEGRHPVAHTFNERDAAAEAPAVPVARVNVLLCDAYDSNALSCSIAAASHGRRKPRNVADDADVPPRHFLLHVGIQYYVALAGGQSAAVAVAGPLNLHSELDVMESIVLVEQL